MFYFNDVDLNNYTNYTCSIIMFCFHRMSLLFMKQFSVKVYVINKHNYRVYILLCCVITIHTCDTHKNS